MSSSPPNGAALGNVLNYISAQFGMLGAQILDLSKRQDSLRDHEAAQDAQMREALEGLRDRIEELERGLAGLRPSVDTTHRVLSEMRPVIEDRLVHAARVAEGVRGDFALVSARYQQSLGELQTDWDARLEALRAGQEIRLEHAERALEALLAGQQRDDLLNRVVRLEASAEKRRGEEVEITKTRIQARGNVLVALIAIVSGIVAGVVSIIVALVSRGSP